MKSRLLRGFMLDGALIEPLRGRVSRQDTSSHLPPKAVAVLLQLASGPGELITREKLLESIWGNPHTNQDALNHAVSEIRSALGDHPHNPRFIQTIPKQGYRLLVKPRLSDPPKKSRPKDSILNEIGLPLVFQELMRRKVVQTGVAYLIVGWLLIQIADTAFDNLGLPWWSAPFTTMLVVSGFPIALILSWFIEFAGGKIQLDRRKSSIKKNKSGIAYLSVVGALLVSAAGLSTYRLFDESDSLFGTPPGLADELTIPANLNIPILPNSVAVLRFMNIGGDKGFSDGLSENLLHTLASFNELSVPSRTSTWALSDKSLQLTQIAKRLHVRYILEGSVHQANDNIRVTTQLIDGRSGHHLWSENYDRQWSATEYFSILDDIARRVAERMQGTLSLESSAVLARVRTKDTAALGDYLEGKAQLRQPKTDESLGKAVTAFESAIGADSHYTEAHAGLCESFLAWYVMTRDTSYFEKAEKSCLRSLTLDDSLGEVYAAMGSLHRYAGRFDHAQLELEKARSLLPHSAPVLEELGRVYRAQNKLALAEKTLNEAIMQDPSNWSVYKSLGNFLYRTGRYSEAIPLYQHVLELDPDNASGYNNLGVAYFMLGQFDQAVETWDHIIYDSPTRSVIQNYANSLFYLGKYEQSVQMYEKALETGENDYRIWENMAASLHHIDGAGPREMEISQRAIELARQTLQINPNDRETLSRISLLYNRCGDKEKARESYLRLQELGWDDPDVSFIQAKNLLELGDFNGAFSELERAKDMGFPTVLIAADPDFESLRASPQFAVLVGHSL